MSLSLRANVIGFLVGTLSLSALAAIEAPTYGANDLNGGNWTTGSGSQLITGPQQCVYSTSNRNKIDRGNPTDYRVQATVQGGSQAAFVLDNDNGTGSTPIPFKLSYRDSSGAQSQLAYNAWSSDYVGAVDDGNGCVSGQNNEQWVVDIAASDLNVAEAGTYRATLLLAYEGGRNFGQSDSSTVTVRITIDDYGLRIRNVGDVDLGAWDGVSAEVGRNEPFCVTSASYNAQMNIKAISSNYHSGDQQTFAMKSGASEIGYRVFVAENTNASASSVELLNGASSPLSVTGISQFFCSLFGSDNASIYVQTSTDLNAATPGNYSDVLTLRLEPM